MYNAFTETFAAGFDNVVLIGSDIPDLPADVISEAFSALAAHEAAIGPADDGGYYLIGIAKGTLFEDPFTEMPWGTTDVLEITLGRLEKNKRKVCLLPVLQDVDTFIDLQHLAARLSRVEGGTVHTRRILERMKMI
jgi:uncharacterized protein